MSWKRDIRDRMHNILLNVMASEPVLETIQVLVRDLLERAESKEEFKEFLREAQFLLENLEEEV